MTISTSKYTGLITSEHADKPNFVAMVAAVSGTFVDLQNFLNALSAQFSLDTSVGVQEDAVGQWVGLNRNLSATVPGLFVQAPDPSVVPLGDDDYRTLLRGKIGANGWNGTVADAYTRLSNLFGAGYHLFMQDNQDMSMVIAVAGVVPNAALQAALKGGYMQVRPAGVLASYVFPTAPGGPLFGFDVENAFVSGFDVGVWATTP